MSITAHFESRYHERITVRGERSPAEPEVGIRLPQWEIEESFDEEGQAIELNEQDLSLACEALEDAYNDLRWGVSDYNAEPTIDPDCGFDPYLGSYTDDC